MSTYLRWRCQSDEGTLLRARGHNSWLCCGTQVGASYLTDLTLAEEACCSASLQVAVGTDGSLRGMTKAGRAALSPDALLVGHGRMYSPHACSSL
jgi:hypothetical protein